MNTDIVSAVTDATTQLQRCYISSRFSSFIDEWPPYQPKNYTTLAFIHNKGKYTDAVRFSVPQGLAIAGKINLSQSYTHSQLTANTTRKISDIFLPDMASDGSFVDLRKILIEGAPGIGKTVLAKEIAYQWAKNQLLTSKRLLFLVFLRECLQKSLRTIEDLVQYTFRTNKMVKDLATYLLKTDGKDALIIFDGFDELSEENRRDSIIIDIVEHRILCKICLVITSRPTASSDLHRYVDRRVEIVGFTEEDRLDYIQTALKNSEEQVIALQDYLQSNPTINALCYIPLNMTILLSLVEDGIDRLPKTQTEMYKKFTEMTIVRFIKKYKNYDTVINIANLPHPYNKLFIELTELAYKALETDKIVFTLSEIKEDCPKLTALEMSNNWNGLGLLKAVKYFSTEMGNDQVTFHFLHFSIQEYMAAWYISKLSNSKQIDLLRKTFWEHRYYNTWIMYVGITCGSSFSLRHFLSGNRFQFHTKLFKTSKVSNKYLKRKIKCLHLFQCLVEASKEDTIESVMKELFQNKQIDFSNQTLLPQDLNTLGFFLITSINKEWDELNLSNCNIGSNGSNVLCDRFLNKDVRRIVTIKMVNFSYNQLNFSSLMRLCNLFNSWHTSELIISDVAILDNTTNLNAIKDFIFQSSTLELAFIGSFLFSKNLQLSSMPHVLSNTTNIESMCLLNCNWKSSNFVNVKILTLSESQKLHTVHIIGLSLVMSVVQKLAMILLSNNDSVNMFVYDPSMSDEIAGNISTSLSEVNEDISGVMLIVSSSKVQGIVNTCSLNNELSSLELFNFAIYVRYLNTKLCPWKANLPSNSSYKETIIYTFVELFYKFNLNWRLKIAVTGNNVIIVHNMECDINELMKINEQCSTLYILNSPCCMEMLHSRLLDQKYIPNKLFICDTNTTKYSRSSALIESILHCRYHHNISAVLVTNNVIAGIHANSEQIALAFHLQPSPTTWIQYTAISADVFYQVIDTLLILKTEWIELDFMRCNIGDVECEIIHKKSKSNNFTSTVQKFNISLDSHKLSVSGVINFASILLMWKLQVLKLNIVGTSDVIYDYLIKNLTTGRFNNAIFFITCIYNHKQSHIVCNTNWNKIAKMKISEPYELYFINCDLQSKELLTYLNTAHNLLRLSIIDGTVSEEIILGILRIYSYNEVVEVSISNVSIINGDGMVRNLIKSKEYFLEIKSNLVLSTKHWLCVYNATEYQLRFINSYFMNQTQPGCYKMILVTRLQHMKGDKMYVFQYNSVYLVRFRAKMFQAVGTAQIIAMLSNTTSLNTIGIENYSIANKTVPNDIASAISHNTCSGEHDISGNKFRTEDTMKIINNNVTCTEAKAIAVTITSNTHLQEVIISNNYLQTEGATVIAKGLQKISTLRKLSMDRNNITDEASDYIAAAISHNRNLQELNIGINKFCTPGAIKIAIALQRISTLTKLCFCGNNITDVAANDIASVITCNSHLQELDIGINKFGTPGAIKVAKALQNISTLTKLYFRDNNITVGAVDDIASAITCNSHLKEFDIGINKLGTLGVVKIAQKLQKISSLTKFCVHDNYITDGAACDIARAIMHNSDLQELDVGINKLGTPGAIEIAKALQGISRLKKLHFCDNNVTDEVAVDIANAITCNRHLQELDVGINKFGTLGAIQIAKALQRISALTKLYFCDNNITYEAALDIASAITCNTHLQELDVAMNKFGTIGAIKIAKALQGISRLTKLRFCDNNVTDEAAVDIASAITCNTHLQELDVSINKFGTPGAIKISKALQGISTLTKLCYCDNNISDEAAGDIASAITCNTHLQELVVDINKFSTPGAIKIAKALQRISTLTKLCIRDNNITDWAACDIASAITCNSHLRELDIGINEFGTTGAIKIAKALQGISTLTKLCIRDNCITDWAACDIASAITCNSHLQELDIGINEFGTTGAIKIAKALQGISTLTKLCFCDNNVSDEAASDIASAIICNTHLQELDVSNNKFGTPGAIKFAKALHTYGISTLTKLCICDNYITDGAAYDIASAITCNSHLQELDVGINEFGTPGTIKIAKALQGFSTLTKLCIRDNYITDGAAYDIASAITCNSHLQELDVGINKFGTPGTIKIAKALQGISTLIKLCFCDNSITDEAADDIAYAITCNGHLQEFDIGKNKICAQGAIKIAKKLQKISTLIKLSFCDNNITDEAAYDIASAVTCNSHLQELDVGINEFSRLGIVKIANAFKPLLL